jgi:hypothetical protein
VQKAAARKQQKQRKINVIHLDKYK